MTDDVLRRCRVSEGSSVSRVPTGLRRLRDVHVAHPRPHPQTAEVRPLRVTSRLMKHCDSVPVIDLFAGPGGLGEGFSACLDDRGRPRFKIALSIEKDPVAYQTLLLRSFFRQFPVGQAPAAYYDKLKGNLQTGELFDRYPPQHAAACDEAWNATLGNDASAPLDVLRDRVRSALRSFADGEDRWVLIGGPPCQAYSVIRRMH